jgi:hypothetical protein
MKENEDDGVAELKFQEWLEKFFEENPLYPECYDELARMAFLAGYKEAIKTKDTGEIKNENNTN